MLGHLVLAVSRAGRWAEHNRLGIVGAARSILASQNTTRVRLNTVHAVAQLGAACPYLAEDGVDLLV